MSELAIDTSRKSSDGIEKVAIKVADIKTEAAIFSDSYLPDALRLALDYAGDDGFAASLPQLLHARVSADYDSIIRNTWFTCNSEENLVHTPQGNKTLVTVHGGGVFATPERIEKLFHSNVSRHCKTGFTGLFAAKITEQEAGDVLRGNLPDGSKIPVYSFDEFKRGITDLPRRYAVVMDFEMAKQCKNGYAAFDDLKDDPLMIVRAGGTEAAASYLDKARLRHNTAVMGSWHSYSDPYLNPEELQTTVPIMSGNQGGVDSDKDDYKIRGMDSDFGLRSGDSVICVARYVAVAPQNRKISVRDIPFTV